ncbi:MAG: cytidylate kinase-like family protein [Clostridiaceae bacterium]|nr:cytidylate kinase-like family protein [Clostridiaceae bacterium]MDD6274842.1 cytidylate kinase-like family protein [Clostridiaceae bacterium]
MEKKIVTISREFGSGGRSIGRIVAEKLGFKFYDQELILEVAKESGLAKEVVAAYEEYATHKNSFLYAIAMSNGGGVYGGLSFANQIQIAQAKVISNAAEQGNCVIVGRGADYILRDREDCLNVFIHADMKFRAERIVRLYGETNKAPEERLRDKDAKRKVFYKSFTMRDWGVCQNYHLALDSSVIGIDQCADIITKIVEESRESPRK